MTFFEKFLRIFFLHIKCHQRITTHLGFEDRPILPLALTIVIIRIIVNSLILLYESLIVHQMIANLMLSPKIMSDCPGKQFLGRVKETMTYLIADNCYY